MGKFANPRLGGADGSRNNYPEYLAVDLSVPVINEGLGGDTSTQIAQRMLATPASLGAGNCHVIWSGSNNPTQVSQILSDVTSMVNVLASPKCYLVLGDVNQVVSPIGSSTYNSIIATNSALASQYGSNYLNIRQLLVQAYNPALPLDVADHASDIIPSSLRAVVSLGNITSGALDGASCILSVSSGTQGSGTVLIIDSGTILINAVTSNNITACSRGYNGTVAAARAAYSSYSKIDGIHAGFKGLEFVASQVAGWFRTQSWPLCSRSGVICPFPLSFTTLLTDSPAPIISAVTASGVTGTAAIVTWSTDQPATSLVKYGVTTQYDQASTPDSTLITIHSMTLTGLKPVTTYDFDVVSANSAGKISTSVNATFTTSAPAPPVISSVATANLTPTSVTISWTTGASGYAIAEGSSVPAAYANFSVTGALTYTWSAHTTDSQALQSMPGLATRIASAYTQYGGQTFTMNIGINDGNVHTISLYLLDWDGASRGETVTILDAATSAILDSRQFSGFTSGLYASWRVSGNVVVKVTPNNYVSPVVSGIFFN